MNASRAFTTARILAIDDDPVSLKLIELVLKSLGFTNYELLADSALCPQKLAENPPDLVITDLEMPGFSGMDVIGCVRDQTPAGECIPILVLTATESTVKKRQALDKGATDFLFKPFDPPELQARVRNLLHLRQAHQATLEYSQRLEQTVAARTQQLAAALEDLKANQRLMLQQERVRAFAAMAGGVVHDFNNTLMTIIGYSGLLTDEPELLADQEEARRLAQIIHTAGRDAAQVVDRLRDLYRERDDHDEVGPVDVNAMLKEALEITEPKWRIQPMAEGRPVEMTWDLQPLPVIAANAAELREVVTNLVFNAVDAMPTGGTITLRTRAEAGHVAIDFTDSGTGMPAHVREQCLEPFFTTKGKQGTGLGLPMVAAIVKRHKGEMQIESTAGVGTTICIRLPIGELQSIASRIPEPAPPDPLKIIIVDDDSAMRELISTMLVRDGHEVVSARNGLEALDHLQKGERFDVMLTDLAMPGMSGAQLAEHARHLDPHQAIVLLTGFPVPKDQHLPGIHGVLQKPATVHALRTALSAVTQPIVQAAA